MREALSWKQMGELEFLQDQNLSAEEIIHGFLDSSVSPAGASYTEVFEKLKSTFGLEHLVLLNQIHTDTVVDLRNDSQVEEVERLGPESVSGDAILLTRKTRLAPWGALIRTADCLPVIIVAKRSIALVHAGWRGVACRVASKALRALLEDGDEVVSILIGPAAGAESYEVGEEVLLALGGGVVSRPSQNKGKYLLNLSATLQNSLDEYIGDTVRMIDSGECTISNERFHSFRRDGVNAGRNFSFVIPKSEISL